MGRKYKQVKVSMVLTFMLAFAVFIQHPTAFAEQSRIVVGTQAGIDFLPLAVMQDNQLIEKKAKLLGLRIDVEWANIQADAVNDALLVGSISFASHNITSFMDLWSATKNNKDLNVKAVAGISAFPVILVTNNPAIKSLKDFGATDKIAILDPKSSFEAQILQMISAKVFGKGHHNQLRNQLVKSHPSEASHDLIQGKNGITAHMVDLPYATYELEQPDLRAVLTSDSVLREATTSQLVYSTSRFYRENPKIYRAFNEALFEAMLIIKRDPGAAIASYRNVAVDELPIDILLKTIKDPNVQYSTKINNVMKLFEFRYKVGAIKNKPKKIKDVVFW